MATITQKHSSTTVQRGNFAVPGPKESKTFPDGSSLIRANEIPWTPWAMEGSWFRLLRVNRDMGIFYTMIKFDATGKDLILPDHHHFGEAHAFVLSGDFSYEYGTIYTGDYICEAGGINHKPTIGKDGAVFLVIFHAGVSAVGANGLPEGEIVDCEWMYRAAKANNAAGHLPPPPHQEMHAAAAE